NGRKPQLPVAIFPSSGLSAAVALAGRHPVGHTIRDADDGANLPLGEIVQLFPAGPVDTAITTHPEVAAIIFENARDDIIKETFLGRDANEFSVFEAIDPAPIGADPERAISVFVDFANVAVRQTLFGGVVGKLAILETAQPAFGADPERPLSVFDDVPHIIVNQPLAGAIG